MVMVSVDQELPGIVEDTANGSGGLQGRRLAMQLQTQSAPDLSAAKPTPIASLRKEICVSVCLCVCAPVRLCVCASVRLCVCACV